jgi:hypothetical protein
VARHSATTNEESESGSLSIVYVQLNSGEVIKVTPATSVLVQPHMVIIYDGELAVASYPRQDVFSCTRRETCPSFT